MLKQVYKINENGNLAEILVKDFDKDGNCTEELAEDIITDDPPNGLYHHRWTGSEWISTITEEEYISTLPKAERALTQEEIILQKVIDLLPASVIAESIEEQYQAALAELNLN